MSQQIEDHFARNLVIAGICLIIAVGLVLLSIHNSFQQEIDKAMQRWQAEHDKVESMTCDELKDGMLYNQIKASDNKQRATERFLGMGCAP